MFYYVQPWYAHYAICFFCSGFIVSAGLIALVCWVCFAWEFLCGYCLFSWCWLRVLWCCGQQLLCCDSNCVAVFLLWQHLVQQLFYSSGTGWGGFFGCSGLRLGYVCSLLHVYSGLTTWYLDFCGFLTFYGVLFICGTFEYLFLFCPWVFLLLAYARLE